MGKGYNVRCVTTLLISVLKPSIEYMDMEIFVRRQLISKLISEFSQLTH